MSFVLSIVMWVFCASIMCWILKIGLAGIEALGNLILGLLGVKKEEDGRQ